MPKNCFIHPTAVVEEGVQIGDGGKIWHHAHIREGAKLGENCVVGKGVFVDQGVQIGNGVKIQNFCSLYKGVTIEKDVFIGPHVVFTNDFHPRAFSAEWEVVPTLVKMGASIAANSVLLCGIVLSEYCMIGAGSVVTRDVPAFGLAFGNPARLRGVVCKCGMPARSLDRPGTHRCKRCGEVMDVSKELINQIFPRSGGWQRLKEWK